MDNETVQLLETLNADPARKFTTAELSKQTGIGREKVVKLLRKSRCVHEHYADSKKTLVPSLWQIKKYAPGTKKPWAE